MKLARQKQPLILPRSGRGITPLPLTGIGLAGEGGKVKGAKRAKPLPLSFPTASATRLAFEVFVALSRNHLAGWGRTELASTRQTSAPALFQENKQGNATGKQAMKDYRALNLYKRDIEICREALLYYLKQVEPCEEEVMLCLEIEDLLEDAFSPWEEEADEQ